MTRKSQWFEDYEVRTGNDDRVGIYARETDTRLATFNKGVEARALATRLKLMFNRSHTVEKNRKIGKRRRAARSKIDETRGGGHVTPTGGANW